MNWMVDRSRIQLPSPWHFIPVQIIKFRITELKKLTVTGKKVPIDQVNAVHSRFLFKSKTVCFLMRVGEWVPTDGFFWLVPAMKHKHAPLSQQFIQEPNVYLMQSCQILDSPVTEGKKKKNDYTRLTGDVDVSDCSFLSLLPCSLLNSSLLFL